MEENTKEKTKSTEYKKNCKEKNYNPGSYVGEFNVNSDPLGGGSDDFVNVENITKNSNSNQPDNLFGDSNGPSNPFGNNNILSDPYRNNDHPINPFDNNGPGFPAQNGPGDLPIHSIW